MEDSNNSAKVTRREALATGGIALAGVAAGYVTENSIASIPDVVSNLEVGKVLSEKLRVDVEFVIGDHLPPEGAQGGGYAGEVPTDFIEYNSGMDLSNLDKESVWVGGIEFLGRDRTEHLINRLESVNAVVAMDGSSYKTTEYLDLLKSSQNTTDIDTVLASFFVGGGSLVSLYKVLNKIYPSESPEFSRRDFLKIGAAAYLTGIFLGRSTREVRNNPGKLDLSGLPQVWQELYSLFPIEDSIKVRNLSIANSVNSLANLDLADAVTKLSIYAGSGHQGLSKLLMDDEGAVANELRGQMKDKLERMADIYGRQTDGDNKNAVMAVATAFGSLFPPVLVRLNEQAGIQAAGIRFAKDINQNLKSSGLIFAEVLGELTEEARANNIDSDFYRHLNVRHFQFLEKVFNKTTTEYEGFKIVMPGESGGVSETTCPLSTDGILEVQNGHIVGVKPC